MNAVRELLGPITYHAALGVAVAAVVWTAGMGIVSYGERVLGRRLIARDFALAYGFGLLAVVAVSFLALLHAAAGIVGLVALTYLCWIGVRGRGRFGIAPAAALAAALRALPFAYGYALVCGFLFHGAARTLDAHPLGDNATWVSETISARQNPIHLHDLTALGYVFPRPETSAPFVDAALSRIVPVDFYLAGTSLLTAFLIISLAVGFGATALDRTPRVLSSTVVALLGLAAIGYPSWIPESPPVALALPLVFGLYWLATTEVPLRAFLVVGAMIAVALALTKILAGVVLFAVVVLRLARLRGTMRQWLPIVALVGAACIAGAGVLFFTSASWILDLLSLRFVPADTIRHARELTHVRRFQTLGPLAQLGGVLCLLAVLVLRRRWIALTAVGSGLAAYWLIGGQTFQAAFYFGLGVVAVDVLSRDDARAARLLGAAAVLLGLSAWWIDQTQSRGSFAMALLAAAGIFSAIRARTVVHVATAAAVCAALVAIALVGQPRLAVFVLVLALALAGRWEGRTTTQRRALFAFALVALLVIGSFAALARAQHRGTANFGVYDSQTYPREQYDVWREVERLTDRHALVFTSQTGLEKTTFEGWDYYPAIGERQVYLAGWLNSALSVHIDELRRRLNLNSAVLTGARPPTSIPGATRFDRYLAVLRSTEHVPQGFRRLYGNRLYTLYEIAPAQ